MIVVVHETLCPEMIVLFPGPFWSRMIVMFLCDSLNDMFHHREDFQTLDSRNEDNYSGMEGVHFIEWGEHTASITLFRSETLFCRTKNITPNISSFKLKCGEYFT